MDTITESQTAEHYRTLFNSIDEGFCIIEVLFDSDNKPVDYLFLEVNPAFVKQTGLSDAVGRTVRDMLPLHEGYWFEIYGKVALTGEPARFQNRAEQLNRYYNVYAYRFGRPEDKQVAVLFSDITVQKETEEELVRSEVNYKVTLDNLLEGCAIISYDWKYLYVNEKNAMQAHCTKEEMIGRKVTDIIPGVESSTFYQSYKRCMEERKYQHVEDSFTFADGSTAWYESFAHPVPDGIFILSMDITDRKSAEMELHNVLNELRDSESKLKELQVIAKMGITDWNLEDGTITWSDELYTLFERDSSAGPPSVDEAREYMHPDDQDRVRKELESADRNGIRTEFRIILPGNKLKHLAYYVKPIFNEKGKQIRRIGSLQDITETRLTEIRLTGALEMLQEKIQEKEILLRELYHRTKNNMQVISSLLNLRGAKIADEAHRSAFLEMKNRVQAMSLVHERLYRTRSLSRLNLGSYIKELVEILVESHCIVNKVNLEFELTDIEVSIDTAIPCGLVITELVLNVLKYAFPENKKGTLSISLSTSDNEIIKLKICDDGIGIPPGETDNMEKLGIQIVKGLVEDQLKGEITLLSTNGTCWMITFMG